MKQKLIYLASPFSHEDPQVEDSREALVTMAAANLTKQYGYAMFLPITQSHAMKKYVASLGGSFDKWKNIDLFMIKEKADEIWVVTLDGWKKSIGVKEEIACAKKHKKPIKYVHKTNKGFNINWEVSDAK